jgi:hypothetical protein
MHTITKFKAYPAVATAKFTCQTCGKANRTRTFKVECTVNPFNKKPDGTMRTPSEVRQQSKDKAMEQRDMFLTEPMCRSCENDLSWTDRKALYERRQASVETA